jgi:lysozyme family protein
VVECLVDDAVMRGVPDTIKRFQAVLGFLPPDGILGPKTVTAALAFNATVLLKKYVVERCVRLCRLVERDPTQATNITGWITRVLGFLP